MRVVFLAFRVESATRMARVITALEDTAIGGPRTMATALLAPRKAFMAPQLYILDTDSLFDALRIKPRLCESLFFSASARVSRVLFQKQIFFWHYAPVILNRVKELSSIPKQISLSVIKSVFASLRAYFFRSFVSQRQI